MKRVLITGISGYIGRRLLQALKATDSDIKIYGLASSAAPSFDQFELLEIDLFHQDLPSVLNEIQPDLIYHAVGVNRHETLQNQIHLHVEGTRHLLQSLADQQLSSRVVILGSAAEYGIYPHAVDELTPPKPVTDYGVSKLSQTLVAQLFARKYHLPIMIARLFNVYGDSPVHLAIASLASQVAYQEALSKDKTEFRAVINAYHLESVRDFIHVDDVCQALIALAEKGCPGEVYNVASGIGTPVGQVLEQLLSLSNLEKPLVNSTDSEGLDFSQANIGKIQQQTGWQPKIDLTMGLAQELETWRQKNYQVPYA